MTTPDSPQRREALKAVALASLGLPAGVLAQQPKDGIKELRYPFEVAETGFDPAQINDIYSRIVTANIFEGLYNYDHLARPFKIRPCTAAAMPEASDDFRTYVVRVKPGIHFQDDPVFNGKPRELVAEDYVYAFKRFFDPRWKSPVYATLAEVKFLGIAPLRERALNDKSPFDYDTPVEGLRALDRYTIQFRFEAPLPRFIQILATGDLFGAVAREVVESYGDKTMEKPVGTGPFRLTEWRRSSKIVLERNPTYRDVRYDCQPNADDAEGQALLAKLRGRRLPMIDRVVISIIDEVQPRWLSFLNQQQDLMYLLPFDFVNVAAPNGRLAPNLERQGVRMWRTLASDVSFVYFNMQDPVIGGYEPEKVALRRAINLGINLDQEVRLFWRGQAVPAQSPLVPNTVGYSPKFVSENSQYDLPRAKALLETFGYVDRDGDGWREQPDGSPLVLQWATSPDQRSRQRDELRRKDLAALGIRIEFRSAKWPENLRNARAGKLQVWNLGTSAAGADGQPSLDRGATVHAGGQNFSRFSHKRFDEIYTQMRSMPDGPEREAMFDEAKRILIAYAPYKYGVHRILTDLAWPWLEGFRRPPYWLEWWQYVDIDVVQQAKAIK
jgi:ABC-type transport system substrate-binding protein